jgi:hypothetical protein
MDTIYIDIFSSQIPAAVIAVAVVMMMLFFKH